MEIINNSKMILAEERQRRTNLLSLEEAAAAPSFEVSFDGAARKAADQIGKVSDYHYII